MSLIVDRKNVAEGPMTGRFRRILHLPAGADIGMLHGHDGPELIQMDQLVRRPGGKQSGIERARVPANGHPFHLQRLEVALPPQRLA
jgi:hypothetical protein